MSAMGFNSTMKTIGRIILGSILGAMCGALSGAAMLGVPTYLSTESGFLGPESAWAPLGALVGFLGGILPGALIGFLVAKFRTDKVISAIVGAAVGISVLVGLFVWGGDPFVDWDIFQMVLPGIPVGGVIGVIISTTNKGQHTP